jgi:hypothetical protein
MLTIMRLKREGHADRLILPIMGGMSCVIVAATVFAFSKHPLSDSPLIILVVLGVLLGFWLLWIGTCVIVAAVKARSRDDFDPFAVFQDSLILAFLVGIAAAFIYLLWTFAVRPLFPA